MTAGVYMDETPKREDQLSDQQARGESRRAFLADIGRTIVYAAPVVLLFDPPEALAASGMSGVS